MPNFWEKLNKPIFALAPMEEVTDVAFREMFAKYGKPDVMYTEFVNVDGLTHPEGYKRLSLDLKFTEIQRPMVAQIWGRSPLKFEEAAGIIAKLGFDGIDINMGCPQDKEIGQGTCAALIREPELAKEIIKATMKGSSGLPVSVKTRLGYSSAAEMETWLRHILECEPAAVAIHGRTKQEKSKVPAQWGEIAKAVKVRDQLFPPHPALSREGRGKAEAFRPLIIGNGDIKSREEGLARIKETGVDGVMVGRGAFGNPWFFNPHYSSNEEGVVRRSLGEGGSNNNQITVQERLRVMLEHAELFNKEFSGIKSFVIMRKHFKAYASGFDGASELRAKLMETKNLEETKQIVVDFLNSPS